MRALATSARRLAAVLLLAAAGPALVACAPREPKGPNLFLVVLDAASAAYLSPWGAAREQTPEIERLAADSVVFENAYSQTASTVPSTASLLSGVRPTTHRMMGVTQLPEGLAVLPEWLRRAGYRTIGVVANPNAGLPDFGFDRGYDEFVEVYRELRRAEGSKGRRQMGYPIPTPPDVNAHVLRLLEGLPARGVFFHVHYLYPHSPYDAPRRYHAPGAAERPEWERLDALLDASKRGQDLSAEEVAALESAYRANVRWADEGVGVLLAALRERGLYDEALIVLAADHGEAFGGHGFFQHNTTLYDDMTRIPLLIKLPLSDGVGPGRVAALAETVDLAPTLLDHVGLPLPAQLEGHSLLPVARRERAQTAGPEVVLSTTALRSHAIRLGPHKLILGAGNGPQPHELYDLGHDPDEQRDLATEHPERAAALRARLHELQRRAGSDFEAQPRPARDDPALRRLLEQLGYVEESAGSD